MPQSLSNILVHLVFSIKDRVPLLAEGWRDELHGYTGGIIRRCGSDLLAANPVSDHLPLLFALPRTITVANLVKEIKTGSSKWIHENNPRLARFHWQAGYGAFSISPSHKKAVVAYIAGQQEHHRKVTFQNEYRRILKKYEIEYDERYVWD